MDFRFRILKGSDEPGEDGAREVGSYNSGEYDLAKGHADRLAREAKEEGDIISTFQVSDVHRQHRPYRGRAS
jgi:hypothetical protein